MIKIIKKKGVFDLRQGEFIKVLDEFKEISSLSIKGDEAYLLLDGEIDYTVSNETLDMYEFAKLDSEDGIKIQVNYGCNHCNRPVMYDSIEGIKGHTDRCLFNENNHMCTMCKYLTVYEEAPYPKNHQMRTPDVEWAFGNYRKPYCERYDKYLDEETLINSQEDCFELELEEPKIKHTKEYDKWVELSSEHYDSLDKEVEED